MYFSHAHITTQCNIKIATMARAEAEDFVNVCDKELSEFAYCIYIVELTFPTRY